MTTTTLTSKSQTTIPKAIRHLLGLKPGGKVTFEIRNHEVVLRAAQNPAGLLSAYVKGRPSRSATAAVGEYLGKNDEKIRTR